jgi:hypothetical protein
MTTQSVTVLFGDPRNTLGVNEVVSELLRHNNRHPFIHIIVGVQLASERSGLDAAVAILDQLTKRSL